MKININLDVYISKEDIECIINMAGYGIGYWASKGEIDTDKEGNIISYTVVDVDDDKEYKLTTDDICEGIERCIESGWSNIIYRDDYLGITKVDSGEIDAESADVIIQYACFNRIVYA